jgi:hypothetical protein
MAAESAPASLETVEAVVRKQLTDALGGRRGMLEAAVPTVLFTLLFLTTKDLRIALVSSLVAAVTLLVIRLVQRSSPQFVINALVGIGIGWFFVHLSQRSGGSADDQALAYFLPGIIYSAGYSVVVGLSCLVRWPLVGFMIGSVTGDPTAWHDDPQIVKLCTRLTWLLVLPGMVGVALQGPVWLAGHSDALKPATAVAVLAVLRLGLGWPLRIGALSAMVWLLARNHTPVEQAEPAA